MDLFLTGVFASFAIGALKMKLPERFKLLNVWRIVSGMILIYLSFWSLTSSAVGYNDAGNCTHIRTFRGAEGAKCNIGWYFSGWGETTTYPHFITISNTTDTSTGADAVAEPYKIRFSDNWSGRISQTTRFRLPRDRNQFVQLARNFGSPERLVSSALRPAINASMDSVASIYSMEEYHDGSRDRFKTEFSDSLSEGLLRTQKPGADKSASELDGLLSLKPRKKDIRTPHSFQKYGITVDLSIVHSLQPDSDYVNLIKDRKHAENKRILAKEKRLAEEEQHLLAVARQEIEIAKQKTEALIDQAKRTVNAETDKIIGIIAAKGALEEAQISVKTVQNELKRSEITAEINKIGAQVKAFERKAMLGAETEFDKKLQAYVDTNEAWARAYGSRLATIPSKQQPIPSRELGEKETVIEAISTQLFETLGLDSE